MTTAVDSSNVVDAGVVVDVVGDGSSNRTLDSGDEDRLAFRLSGLGLGLDSSFRLSFRDEKSGARCSMGGGPDLCTISRELSEVNPAPALASLKANKQYSCIFNLNVHYTITANNHCIGSATSLKF